MEEAKNKRTGNAAKKAADYINNLTNIVVSALTIAKTIKCSPVTIKIYFKTFKKQFPDDIELLDPPKHAVEFEPGTFTKDCSAVFFRRIIPQELTGGTHRKKVEPEVQELQGVNFGSAQVGLFDTPQIDRTILDQLLCAITENTKAAREMSRIIADQNKGIEALVAAWK